jgi:hypothetical protein
MLLVKKRDKNGGRHTTNSHDNIQYNKNHDFVTFERKRSNLLVFFFLVVAAFVVDDDDFVMEDVVFIVCDFLKLETPSSPSKNIFFGILQEKKF